jgi:hypothetical protein
VKQRVFKYQFTYLGGALFFPQFLETATLSLGARLALPPTFFLNGDYLVTMVVSLHLSLNCEIVAFTKTEIWKSDDEREDSKLDRIQSESHK